MQIDDFRRLLLETSHRYDSRAEPRGLSEQRLRQRRILDADAPRRVDLRLKRLHLDRSVAETMLRDGPGLSGPYLPGTPAGDDPVVLERVLGQNELMPISFLQHGATVAESVGRITICPPNGPRGFGTGFLVGPRLLLTNNHVLKHPDVATHSFVEFNYETLANGTFDRVARFGFTPEDLFLTDRDLDFTLLAVEDGGGELERFGWNRLIAEEGKAIVGERLNIIQHPAGELKQLALRENRLLDVLDDFLHYHTDTAPGSSGAPVFNDQWEVVALHHAGVPQHNAAGRVVTRDGHTWQPWMGDHRIHWIANEGTRISRIVAAIRAASLAGDARLLRQAMFSARPQSPTGTPSAETRHPHRHCASRPIVPDSDGVASWQIPLTVSVHVGEPRKTGQTPSSSVPSASLAPVRDRVDSSPSAPPADGDVIVTPQLIRNMLSDPGFTELTQQMEALSHSPEGTEATLDKEFGSDAKAVEEFAREWLEAVSALDNASRAVDDGVLFTTRSRLGALMQSSLAERVADTGTWRIGQHGGVEGHELKFSKNDWWGWSKSFFSWVTKTNYHAMLRPANAIPDPLPDNARIAVFSDWGTGLYGAPHIADAIRREGGFDVVMHLGDVYYAGTETEMRKRFLNVWPFGAGTQNRGLNSNHDMYSGGHAYFGLVLPTFNQTSSYFAIQNAHWTLVCLDTAYKDFDLDAEQITWIQNVLEQAGARKVVFFSHHQLFSRLDEQGDKLVRGLQSILEARRVYYWYWGHEHRCIVYDAHEAWGLRGRCVGHGGMPQKRGSLKDAATARRADIYAWKRLGGNGDVPGSHALDGPNVHIPEKEEEYLPHGYVILELDGGSLREIYMSADGKQLSLDGLDSA